MIEDFLREAIDKFNERTKTDEKLRGEVAGLNRTLQITLKEGKSMHFVITDGVIGELKEGAADNPEIVVESDEETLKMIYSGEMRAMKALALKKIKVHASLQDMLRIRKLF